ncbi:heterokaryon incompatibility protein-domain-containing protein [Podospora conica]|nr:heterokaryon incompatibility protein-domain-containing protein [Schizothecium conicum]
MPKLCEYCAEIPFSSIAAQGNCPGSNEFQIVITSRSTQCPFCQLVIQVMDDNDESRSKEIHDELVIISWEKKRSPGGHHAFFVWGYLDGGCIAFGTPPDREYDSGFRCLRPSLDSMLDINRVSSWIDHCTASHECVSSNPPDSFSVHFPGLQVLRFVDVRRHCIIETKEMPSAYVALSYVWGDVPNLRLTSLTRTKLMQPLALEKSTPIPRTIRDAIHLVSQLKPAILYLWVDSLCLVQDAPEDLEKGLRVMGRIYERAAFTIIAANGSDADAGLPGVVSRRGGGQDILREIQPGIHLGLLFGQDRLLEQSVYQRRAWTMQEYLFSRRVLCFFDDKVFFRCQKSERLETCHDARHPKKTQYVLYSYDEIVLNGLIDLESPLSIYGDMLAHYSRRSLTNQSDAIRALEGISAYFSDKLGYGMLYGLPVGALDYFILFQGEDLYRRPEFPSYSWAGWQGDLGRFRRVADSHIRPWLKRHTWISWYTINGSSRTTPSIVWKRQNSVPFSWEGLDFGETTTVPSITPPVARNSRNNSVYLRFWTLSISLSIPRQNRGLGGWYKIHDKDGEECGKINLGAVRDDVSENEATSVFFNDTGPYEFILLSGIQRRSSRWYGFTDTTPETAGDHELYNVMLLKWDGDVAERRGIGEVWKRGVLNSLDPGPTWKEITLG